mmetsp:Transcript_17695/g.48972  ORF Transcript_17695/g.48972 Transcript_17695/m.48972 type:complete len:472 (-) Transcript_17695:2395-3810(-)
MKMMDSCLSIFQLVWNWIIATWQRFFGPVLTMDDSGIGVRIGSKIAEGGFSVIFHALDSSSDANQNRKYVLKRIRCQDGESRSGCIKESKVHYAIMRQQKESQRHPANSVIAAGGGGMGGIAGSTEETIRNSLSGHIMPLLGTTFAENNTICYMLFPYLPDSLRREVDRRVFEPMDEVLGDGKNKNGSAMSLTQKNQKIKDALLMPPWSETTVLRWFEQLCDAVILMHDAGYTHRDIKLDNVMLHPGAPLDKHSNIYRGAGGSDDSRCGVVLMDYGSAGPITRLLLSRRDVLEISDDAAQHTTISYRPPELFAGELRATESNKRATVTKDVDGDNVFDQESVLDYRKVDSWMLGCTLFAILFGASPGECEFSRSTGQLLIVEPSHNKMLGQMPPWPDEETPSSQWYSSDTKELLAWILTKDRGYRPTVKQIWRRVRELLSQKPTLFDGNNNGMLDVESQVMDMTFASKNVM